GTTGEDVTANARTVKSIPARLGAKKGRKPPATVEIRGEIVIRREDFARLNSEREEEGESVFANPRNAAAGSLRMLDASITASRPLMFFVHSHGVAEPQDFPTHTAFLRTAAAWGFQVRGESATLSSIADVQTY